MKILLDADVLIDVALERPNFVESSDRLLRFVETGACEAGVAWHSLSNLSYLTGKKARGFIRDLVQFVEVPKASLNEVLEALDFPMKDFEDALQASVAVSFGASYVISRNLKHYKQSPVPAISPAEFLVKFAPDTEMSGSR
jgi:hypothetical protein